MTMCQVRTVLRYSVFSLLFILVVIPVMLR